MRSVGRDGAPGWGPPLKREIALFVEHLRSERRASPHTVRGYEQAGASAIQLDVGKLATSYDLGTLALSGWTYWLLYLQGYAQFAQAKAVSDDNIYLTYLVKHFGPAGHDTGIASLLADREQARERVAARYRDCDAFRRCAAGDRSALREIAPLKIILRNPPTPDAKLVYQTGSDVPVRASLDGYHRLFLARLFGVAGLPAEVTSEP